MHVKGHMHFAVHLTAFDGSTFCVWPMIKVNIFATLEFTMTTYITKIAEAILAGCSAVRLLLLQAATNTAWNAVQVQQVLSTGLMIRCKHDTFHLLALGL